MAAIEGNTSTAIPAINDSPMNQRPAGIKQP